MNRDTCVNLVAFIDSALGRGAIKPSEMVAIGVARAELLELIAYVDQQKIAREAQEVSERPIPDDTSDTREVLQEEVLDNQPGSIPR